MAEEDVRIEVIEEEGENNPLPMRRRTYRCKYCHRSFASSQALGGHQNGHRSEREAFRKAQRDADVFRSRLPPPPPPPPSPSSSAAQLFSSLLPANPFMQSLNHSLPPPSYFPYDSNRNQLRYHPYNFSGRSAGQAFDMFFATSSSSSAAAAAAPPPPPPPPPAAAAAAPYHHPFIGLGLDWSRRATPAPRMSMYDLNFAARVQAPADDARQETKADDDDGEIDLTLRL